MEQENSVMNKNEISYNMFRLMQEHAKKYDYASDKKEFLKNVSPYEQKLILLETKRPYEVLNYLDELDLKKSRLILSQLNVSEISKILELFSAEDKKKFYATFSDLDLVNQFISYDKNSFEHIEDLTIDRKVDLLNSSDSKTVSASSKVYQSIDENQKEFVVKNIVTADGMNVLNQVTSDVENEVVIEQEKSEYQDVKALENQEKMNKEIKEEVNKEYEQMLNMFIKSRIEHYKEKIPELSNLDIDNISYSSLSSELQQIISQDFNLLKKQEEEIKEKNRINENELDEQKINEESDLDEKTIQEQETLELFQQSKTACENELIEAVLNKTKIQVVEETSEKTL